MESLSNNEKGKKATVDLPQNSDPVEAGATAKVGRALIPWRVFLFPPPLSLPLPPFHPFRSSRPARRYNH
jgi:hypothetical protein